MTPPDFSSYIQLRCVMGSRAFGLDTASSDTDLRGFYLPPARAGWSLGGVPEQLEYGEECYWEAQKFVALALRANPNILEVLHSPQVVTCTPIARELLDIRQAFLSRRVVQTYGLYVQSQFRRIEASRARGEVRWKHAMHLLRLLQSGTRLLQTAQLDIDATPQRPELLAVRRGEVPWEEVDTWRRSLQAEFEDAAAHTRLPDEPETAAAEAWLLRARRASVDW